MSRRSVWAVVAGLLFNVILTTLIGGAKIFELQASRGVQQA